MKNTKTQKIVGIGLFTAIIVALQLLAASIKFGPFSITLVLAPIVIGAALYGIGAGAWLGVAFGVSVLISGDAAAFMTINPAGTVVTVLLKGMLAGLVAGLIYKALESKNKTVAVVLAGIACPIVNTGIFLAGCYLFFQEWLVSVFGTTGFATVVTGLVSVNFAVELGINMVLASVIVRVIDIGKKQLKKNS
ncbi:ECF transporter S component [Eubacterium coprostanoligenes]|uniref:ECF transporter S component n=1 Tax=Eubacterium coprostanoligenes TaxID=290054 RepID=UPI002354258C|nr:ECF transporter S component [Eubacterium coprostanoligenes]MCI6253751.1 ECF transporter S component [Eubacterium coprostanoligenes]MCI6354926.1 ECF transporter S component [Eubacterium coprostanoligenes]MDD7358216.1 ECF transporter S component [Eubacterium coprostanoligenes]MDY5400499.1 ECF transporter S component [Eubacterium coprostanoligenes]